MLKIRWNKAEYEAKNLAHCFQVIDMLNTAAFVLVVLHDNLQSYACNLGMQLNLIALKFLEVCMLQIFI